ncbi:hypothetical protein SAMN05216315_12428 [Nitrosospira sp. Nsp18]|nr:hypothetical protein SAMN05216315_12428 [Nitrosospira sp. Nsp18]
MSLMPALRPRLRMAPRLERLDCQICRQDGVRKEQENQAIFMESPYRIVTGNEK